MRLIKTYANGRFYDTLNKRYMGKEQLTALLNKKEAIKIVMHKTGKDVTQSVAKRLAPKAITQKESMLNIDNIKKWVADQIDRRIEAAIALINLPTRDQIRRLSADIEKLAKQVDGLQNRLVNAKRPDRSPQPEPTETVAQQA